jgi:ABC-type lipoprotein export system ATPase subunit/GNAT superfamily N-acetyltransferase
MPSSKFVVESKIPSSFRVEKVKGQFDYDASVVRKEFDVDIPIEDMDWNIGLIVGASGSGKTTIAKNVFKEFELFDGFEWSNKTVIDDFADGLSAIEITDSLNKVGFSSPPDWLKPFNVLSNGQKMRAELARLILESDKPIIYDEFTSVVDRQVAKIGSSAIQKYIRRENKQFIAVSCHYDIEEWLEPDWLYDANEKKFYRRSLRRPEIKVDIRKAHQREWELFKEFHYLSSTHNKSAHKYIAEINGEPVAWCSLLHFPHPKLKNCKRIHRIVVKPDYQGIGVGGRFMSELAKDYSKLGTRIRLVTSAPSFIYGLSASKNWMMVRKPSRLKNTAKSGVLAGTTSDARLTASFEFVG